MRYDDMLATLLRQPLDTPTARTMAWRQAVDMLAQGRAGVLADHVLDMLRHLRGDVPAAVRADVARSLAGRRVPPALVRLFAEEPPAIAAPVLGGVRLAPDEWVALLPELGPTARGFVRNRRDLEPAVARALESFGSIDLALGAPDAAEIVEAAERPAGEALPAATARISDVMARIEAFKRQREGGEPAPAPAALDRFRFETDAAGIITWTDTRHRGALAGETIARAAGRDGIGVDGHAAGAFRRRTPYRDARLMLDEGGPFGGDWRVSAVPGFDEASGRFTGYRGVARRPRPDESAAPIAAGPFGSGYHPDSLRQLVHELRTPINAIVGFAELIERQMMGPAALDYRTRAALIVGEGRRLLDAVEDLDAAARMASRRWTIDSGAVDGAALLARLAEELAPLARARGVTLTIDAAAMPPIDADPIAVERMMGRLVQAVLGLAGAGETVRVRLAAAGGATLEVDRPAAIAGRDERTLLDPGYAPDGDWPDAPLLGLGFALRLVRNLAEAARGDLAIGGERFRLRLPVRQDSAGAGAGRG